MHDETDSTPSSSEQTPGVGDSAHAELPAPDPILDRVPSDIGGRQVAHYVLASGERMGVKVAVFPIGDRFINEETGEMRSDLALIESPDRKYQSKALYSEGEEPGTWHWA